MGLLGRGGMGEVYRATDLALGQQVALKFLPEAAARDDRTLARFHAEVRTARQVSHPNVCRVYDIGEAGGQPFISMEYVDGEDLASLLRRIGRLPADKAVQIARGLCAGLAAAHDQGVLHRDLKPANIMIDGRGQVLITDFGLAAAGEVEDVRSGTPAYMAPEQLEGREVTSRSDIYSLGLALYEVFTGRRAFEAASVAELLALQQRAEPPGLSSIAKEIDPAVERVVLRCLAPDPRNRPSSALAVAGALPGGDPLAAALAAGETPSPELVAAAGEGEGMSARAAWLCLAAALAGLALAGYASWHSGLPRRLPLEKPPEALAERARETIRALGFTARPRDETHGFSYNSEYQRYAREEERGAARLAQPPDFPPVVFFWYRQSPRPLAATYRHQFAPTYTDPRFDVPGMARLQLDPRGRLVTFESVPAEAEETAAPFDWHALFAAAGFDMRQFAPVEPRWTPPAAFDVRAAWSGPAGPYQVRVEAASWRGKPVSFRVIGPWTRPYRAEIPSPHWQRAGQALLQVIAWSLLAAGCVLAWRNVREGRGDWRGAWRAAGAVFALHMLSWALAANHVPDAGEFAQFWSGAGAACIAAAVLWLFYMALEPYVRRRWPQALIGWSRLLAGRFRDPVVGRDVLIGLAVVLPYGGVECLRRWMMVRAGEAPGSIQLGTLLGIRPAASVLALDIAAAASDVLLVLFLLVLLRALLRREWLAVAAFVAVFSAATAMTSEYPRVDVIFQPLLWTMAALVIVRFGVLAGMVCHFAVAFLLVRWPITMDFPAWYAGLGFFALALVAALALFGFRAATAGREAVPGRLVELIASVAATCPAADVGAGIGRATLGAAT